MKLIVKKLSRLSRGALPKVWLVCVATGKFLCSPSAAAWVQLLGVLLGVYLTWYVANTPGRESVARAQSAVSAFTTEAALATFEARTACQASNPEMLELARERLRDATAMGIQLPVEAFTPTTSEQVARTRHWLAEVRSELPLEKFTEAPAKWERCSGVLDVIEKCLVACYLPDLQGLYMVWSDAARTAACTEVQRYNHRRQSETRTFPADRFAPKEPDAAASKSGQ